MDRFFVRLNATDSGRRLLTILKRKFTDDRDGLEEVSDAISAVLNETRTPLHSLPVRQDFTQWLVPLDDRAGQIDDGDVVIEFKSIPLKQPLGEFDIVFYKAVFILYSTESRDVEFRIPFAAIQGISSVMIKAEDLQQLTELDPENTELTALFHDQVFIFLNLEKNLSIQYGQELLTTVCIEVSGEVTAISNANGEQETQTGNAVDLILDALYSIGGVAKEKSDQCLHYKTSQGGTFLVPIYHSTGGYLFLMETCLCFSGKTAVYIPHDEVLAIGVEAAQDMYFAFVVYLRNGRIHKFEQLPNAEKQGVLEYCKLKHLKLASNEDLKLLFTCKTKTPEIQIPDNKDSFQVLLKTRKRGEISGPEFEGAEFVALPEEEESLKSEEESPSSSSLDKTVEGEVSWLEMLTAEAEDEYNESEDEDYSPLATKRRREDPEEGRFIKRPCTSDGDTDLVEIESHSSLVD